MITFGRYRIVHRIASGGMAEVYRAVAVGEGGFEKEVVLKRIRPELAGDPRFGAMFVEEARLAATLSHANIVQVLDFGRVDGEYFLTLESVRGRDLRQVLDMLSGAGELLPLDLALLVAVDVARALDYAHRRKGTDGRPLGLVHRDVSPHNVLLSFEGEVKLTDFGIAKVLVGDPGRSEAGAIKGKVPYMSPEQAAGAEVDQRSDLFSFGVLLHALFTGRHPFPGSSIPEILELVKHAEVGPLRRVGEPLPAELETLVRRCLARLPHDRFASAGEVLRTLEAFVGARATRASETDLAAFMKAHFPYEVPLPIVALDQVVEQELRLESTDDGLATFTAVAPAPAAAAAAAAAAVAAAASAAVTAPAAAPAAAAGRRPRGRVVAAAVLALALAAAAVVVWRWLPAAGENGATASRQATPAAPTAARTTVPAAPASAPASVVAPVPSSERTARAGTGGSPVTPSVGRPRPPTTAKARPPASARPAGRGFARFRTEPAYAEVWIGGARRCNTPCTIELPAGTYQVRLVNPTLIREVSRSLAVGPEHTRERPAEVAVPGFR